MLTNQIVPAHVMDAQALHVRHLLQRECRDQHPTGLYLHTLLKPLSAIRLAALHSDSITCHFFDIVLQRLTGQVLQHSGIRRLGGVVVRRVPFLHFNVPTYAATDAVDTCWQALLHTVFQATPMRIVRGALACGHLQPDMKYHVTGLLSSYFRLSHSCSSSTKSNECVRWHCSLQFTNTSIPEVYRSTATASCIKESTLIDWHSTQRLSRSHNLVLLNNLQRKHTT